MLVYRFAGMVKKESILLQDKDEDVVGLKLTMATTKRQHVMFFSRDSYKNIYNFKKFILY